MVYDALRSCKKRALFMSSQEDSHKIFAQVLLELSVRKPLDYSIPSELRKSISVGSWVEVPLRNRTSRGYVVAISNTSSAAKPLPIIRPLSDGPVITKDLFELALWMAKYYATPIEKIIKTMLPTGVRKAIQPKKQYFVKRAKTRSALSLDYQELIKRAPQQAKAIEVLLQARRGMLLSELLEKAACHASSVTALHEKGLITLEMVRTDQPIIYGEKYFRSPKKVLRQEQEKALLSITDSLSKNSFSVKLLFGVTGSGKTEVYMQAIEHALDQGKGILMLVPEIALTNQTISRFKSRFEEPIAVLHHRLSDGERFETWNEIRSQKKRIVIGARSAIFSPVPNLGLIIVDEEHEQSYKQSDESPTYHARDLAIMRGKLSQSTVILGSATPSLESYYNAKNNKYDLITLFERGKSITLPTVHIVDMQREREKKQGLFSELLLEKIADRASKGEQTLLFLNRRGYHTTCTCEQCHEVLSCRHCDSALTFHRSQNILTCHLCGYTLPPPKTCPACNTSSVVQYKGVGTEKIEAGLRAIFPSLRTLRADADTTRHKGSLEKILNGFRTGKADLMVGTQMIAKGLHFPDVTLVGVINCDATLQIPDFRAQESVFQLITQVSGRAGRGYAPGEVILQTFHPSHPTITAAAEQNYPAFFKEESAVRQDFGFPPFSRIVRFVFSGTDEKLVAKTALTWNQKLQKNLPSSFFCHPALPCGHAKIQDRWRYQCLIRGPSVKAITSLIGEFDKSDRLPHGVSRFCDVDPISTFF